MKFLFFLPLLGATFLRQAFGLASTDEYRDADIQQTGYLPNHNMDPNIVNSAAFGLLWKIPFNAQEQFYAKPLTYTPLAGGPQLVFLASNMNYIRTLDAKTGALINSKQVHTPFLQSDVGCTDMPNYIGIAGTPTIDPATDIVYFFSKTYIPNFRVAGNTGVANGVYYFHGVNINTLQDVFPPVLIDGNPADNAPQKYFVGGIILNRPSLLQIGSVVYGAFGGHCDLFNYTGVIVGVDVNQAKVVTQFAMESGPLTPQTNVLTQNGGGGESGVWMSGFGLASDGQRLFAVTGNGDAHENQGAPASGSSGCHTLGEAAVNLAVNGSGFLSLQDYFQPYDYQNMDGGDQDFGSGGLSLLDPKTFNGGAVTKMAIAAGKNGKIYVLDADNLGGYKMGPSQLDGNIQTINTGNSVFGGAGSYPGEGGYIYYTPVGYATQAYSLTHTSGGVPQFVSAGSSNEKSAGRVGVGYPTVTSLNGQAGTAILWMTDPDAGLRAWYAVPQNNVLQTIPLPQVGGANKFQRPAFGDGRVYVTDSNGNLYCLGAPVNLPLNCSSPINFGQVAIGTKATATVTCTANIAVTSLVGLTLGTGYFSASNSSLPTGSLAAGQSFSFPVSWDLTNAQIQNTQNASYGNVSPGVKSTPLTLTTVNGKAGYATSFPISLTGTEISSAPFLSMSPKSVDFGAVIVTNSTNVGTISGIFTIANLGLSNMTILGYGYSYNELSGSPTYTNSTPVNGSQNWDIGYGFTAASLPPVGSIIPPSTTISIDALFDPVNGTGTYAAYFQMWTDGGTANIIVEGTAQTAPSTVMTISDGKGGWLPPSNVAMDFGRVAPGSTQSRVIQICNTGGSNLEIDKSKPPNGVFHISDPTEFYESMIIPAGTCANGTVLYLPNTEEYDVPDLVQNNTWTLNTNDLNWGVHVISIGGVVVSTKVGPVNSNGTNIYNYLGCFAESTNGPRLLPNEPLAPNTTTNDNTNCQNTCYSASQYWFAGTENGDECWCGNTPPPLASQVADTLCNAACPGDGLDRCGAPGYLSIFYDPTKYVAGTNPALYGPQTIQAVGNYVYQGCYSEATTGRALSSLAPSAPSGGFTIELCQAACAAYNYIYFGMEYANQCYCGNVINAGSTNQTSSVPTVNGCSMTCTGNNMEYCGGGNRLNLYMLNGTITTSSSISAAAVSSTSTISNSVLSSVSTTSSPTPTPTGPITVTNLTGYSYLGCYSEATTGRALSDLENPIPTTNVSVENCATACSQFKFFGVEYAGECYCGNVINAGSVNQSSTVPAINGCNMVCKGNASEYCGGGNRLNMYMVNAVGSSSSSVLSSPSSTSSISGTPTPTLHTVTNLAGYNYLGCYSEATNMRALSALQNPIPAANVSVEACARACSSYIFFGVEYAQECYCGNVINAGSVNQTSTIPSINGCSMICRANSSEYCGGSNRLNMYQVAPIVSTSSSITTSSSSIVVPTSSSSIVLASSSQSSTLISTLLSSITTTLSFTSSSISTLSSSTSSSQSSAIPSSTLSSSTSSTQGSAPSSTSLPSSISGGGLQQGGSTLTFPSSTGLSSSTSMSASQSSSITLTSVSTTAMPSSSSSSSTAQSTSSSSAYTPSSFASSTVPSSTSSASSSSSSSSFAISSSASSSGSSSASISLSSSSSSSSSSSFAISSSGSSSASISLSISPSIQPSTSSSSSSLSSSMTVIPSISSSSVVSSVSSSTSSAPVSLWTGAPVIGSMQGTWQYAGCANESSGVRALAGSSYSSNTAMTIEACQNFCTNNNYALAGLEYASQCFCANTLSKGSATGQTGCTMACSGLTSELCGGGNRLSLFNNTAYVYPSSPASYNSYVLQGCYAEASGSRLLSGPAYANTTSMTVESCINFCAANGANGLVAGVEYAQECYCAASLPSTAVMMPASSCNMICKGNNKEFCGGSSLLNVYSYVAPAQVAKRGRRGRV